MLENETYLSIIETYIDTESVKKTATQLKISPVKVRKVLITEGLWSSKTSLEVQHCLNLKMSTAQIAKHLCTTEKAIQQYLPYSRGLYHSEHPSTDAIKSAEYRERIRVAKERTLKKNTNIAIQNNWVEMVETKEEIKKMKHNEIEQYPGMLEILEGVDASKFKAPHFLNPIRLHLELVSGSQWYDYNNEDHEVTEVLKKYGKVEYGKTISRDIIVPSDMPLWALHYTIQKCMGWQNCHLHCFELPKKQFEKICNQESRKFIDLIGVAFRSPWMDEDDEFWADDYVRGSFNVWLKKKYSGPYESLCHGEGIWQCKQDIKAMKNKFAYISAEHIILENGEVIYYWPQAISKKEYDELKAKGPTKRIKKDFRGEDEVRIQEVYTFDEIPLDVMRMMTDIGSINKILERLSVLEVFAIRGQGLHDDFFEGDFVPSCFEEIMNEDVLRDVSEYQSDDYPHQQPTIHGLTDELYYNYDFGDNWLVKITASYGAADLIESGRITQDELNRAVIKMHETYRPVCIAQDGLMVLDDAGGINGYCDFLSSIYEKNYEGKGAYTDKESSLEWAKIFGWKGRMSKPDKLL